MDSLLNVLRRGARRTMGVVTPYRSRKHFCLSAGGCGSKYLVELLRVNGMARCHHEKNPSLDELGVQYYRGDVDTDQVARVLRTTRRYVHFESSNRLFSMARPILQAFPRARFIVLHRDGRDAVNSMRSNPQVEQKLSNNYRFTEVLKGYRGAGTLELLCHYWSDVNARILADLAGRDFLSLRFDDLVSGRVESIERFVGLRLDIRRIAPVNVKPGKEQRHPDFGQWPPDEQRLFWDICGETMAGLGYA